MQRINQFAGYLDLPFVFIKNKIALIALVLLSFSCSKDKLPKVYKTQNVFVVVVDGTRYSENWGEPNQIYTPFLKNEMAKEGVIFTNFRNNGPTYTSSGHASILTGNYESLDNSGLESPSFPNYMNYWMKDQNRDAKSAWVFASKDKIEPLVKTSDSLWAEQTLPSVDCGIAGLGTGYRTDAVTVQHVLDSVERYQPNFVFINLKQPDANGHSGNWESYLEGVKQSDSNYHKIWKYINESPNYKGTTAFFMTNDHGRHLDGIADGFKGHGDDCEGCQHIFLYGSGPDFKKNKKVDTMYEQIDLPNTIGKLFNLDIVTSKGQVIEELFED